MIEIQFLILIFLVCFCGFMLFIVMYGLYWFLESSLFRKLYQFVHIKSNGKMQYSTLITIIGTAASAIISLLIACIFKKFYFF